MKNGISLLALAGELERQTTAKQDMIVPTQLLHHTTTKGGASSITVETRDGPRDFNTTEIFRRQLADKLGIPWAYFERMRSEQPVLLDQNVHTWLHDNPSQRLIRTLDGNARAFLSDRYRRLDHHQLLSSVLPILRRLEGARVESCALTDSRMYLKVVSPNVNFQIAPGDVVQAGVVISNSETGQGSLTVQPLIYRLVCRNGLIRADQRMRKAHIGRVNENDAASVLIFKDDTLAADDNAFFLKVRDLVEDAVAEAGFALAAAKMAKTLGIQLAADPVKSVDALATRYLLNEEERGGVLRALIQGADLTGYGLVNAVTAYAQVVENYDRSTELEAIGGRMIEQSAAEWSSISEVK